MTDAMEGEEFKRRFLDTNVDKNGDPPTHLLMKYVRLLGSGVQKTEPFAHRFMGLPYYTKVTSPLRRFGDMIGHWQIEGALRHEAQTGVSVLDTKGRVPSALAFSKDELNSIITRLGPRERLIRDSKRTAIQHWTAQLFSRAYHYGEAELPEIVHCLITRRAMPGIPTTTAIVQEFGTEFKFEATPEAVEQPELGDWWECTIARVSTYEPAIYLKPMRLISREETRHVKTRV